MVNRSHVVSFFLLGLLIVPMVEPAQSRVQSPDCYPVFEGTPGNGGWYIIPLKVSFAYTANVTAIESWLNGSWVPYEGKFNITEKGELPLFQWRYKTIESGTTWIYDETQCPLKLDLDRPWVTVHMQKLGFWRWSRIKFTVTGVDNTSGIDDSYVLFYIGGIMQFNDTDPSDGWVWVLHPIPQGDDLVASAMMRDKAGNEGWGNSTIEHSHSYPLIYP